MLMKLLPALEQAPPRAPAPKQGHSHIYGVMHVCSLLTRAPWASLARAPANASSVGVGVWLRAVMIAPAGMPARDCVQQP